MSLVPKNIPLEGTRGDDCYWVFILTVDSEPYPSGSTARLYLEEKANPANFTNISGTFDPDGNNDRSRVSFKYAKADNTVVGVYDYDIEVTYPNTDITTHVIGTINIHDDVN